MVGTLTFLFPLRWVLDRFLVLVAVVFEGDCRRRAVDISVGKMVARSALFPPLAFIKSNTGRGGAGVFGRRSNGIVSEPARGVTDSTSDESAS